MQKAFRTTGLDYVWSDGTQTGGSLVLVVAPGAGLRAVAEVRFARGTARKSRWCASAHRVIEWASRSPSTGSLN